MSAILRQRVQNHLDPGFIYVVQMGEHGAYKIGRSADVPRRMSEIGIQLPFPYKLLFAHKVPYAHYTESDLHRDFHWCRTNGEWFALDDLSLARIKSRLLYMQAEWLALRIIERFNRDDLYPDVLATYGRVFCKIGRRNDRRLSTVVDLNAHYIRDDQEDVLAAEVVG